MKLVYKLIHEQNGDVFKKHPNGFHIEFKNGTWSKYVCDGKLKCKLANNVYLNYFLKEEKTYVPYSLKPHPCWCPARLRLDIGKIFQKFVYKSVKDVFG